MMTLVGFWLAFSAWLLYILFEHTKQVRGNPFEI